MTPIAASTFLQLKVSATLRIEHIIAGQKTAMPTGFCDLPAEIRTPIWELAFAAAWRPRIVEIFFDKGEIYSRSPPPPLLQVNRESRYITLKSYKPWLPQFKGTAAHEPWEVDVQKKGSRLSRLNNVCVSLEHDILFINEKAWSKWNFGHLERHHLQSMAINIGGWVHWRAAEELLCSFKSLRTLRMFDRRDDPNFPLKAGKVEIALRQKAERNVNYIVPAFVYEAVPSAHERTVGEVWTSYRYPRSPNRPGRPITLVQQDVILPKTRKPRQNSALCDDNLIISTRMKRTSLNKANEASSLRRSFEHISLEGSVRSAVSQHHPHTTITRRKRKADGDDFFTTRLRKISKSTNTRPASRILPTEDIALPMVVDLTEDDRHLARRQRHGLPTPPSSQESNSDYPKSPTVSQSFARIHEYLEIASSPILRASSAPTPLLSLLESTPFRSPFQDCDEGDVGFLLSPESTTPEAVYVNPSSIIVNLDERIALNSGNTLEDTFGKEDERLVFNNLEVQIEAELSSERSPTQDLGKNNSPLPETLNTTSTAVQDHLGTVSLQMEPSPPYVPKRIVAERKIPDGLELLIEWEDYPEEKDWTWESEKLMVEDVPELVHAWNIKWAANEFPEEVEIYVAEKILGCRNFKSVPHYLVKWKGYDSPKDRTWEPCDRLRVDVPALVDLYEQGQSGKKSKKKL